MRGRVRLCCLLMILQIVSWAGVTSRPMAPNDGHGVPQPGTAQSPGSLQVGLTKGGEGEMKGQEVEEEEEGKLYKDVNKIGSSPPSCDDKCYGCMPCEAIQVPTTTSRIGVQYTNYEPEGWRCKCGPSFYTP